MEAIKGSLEEMRQLFTQRMEEFTEELHNTPSTSSSTNLTNEFSNFKVFVLTALQTLQKQVELLVQKTDDLDMRSRRKILLLHGLPEDTKENTQSVVLSVIKDELKLSSVSGEDISRCHRMGKVSSSQQNRPIVVKFRDLSVRNNIWFTKTQLKGSGITVSEFLTKSRHELFLAARQKFGVSSCWTREGNIYVIDVKGERRRVSCLMELNKIDVRRLEKPASAPAPKKSAKASRAPRK